MTGYTDVMFTQELVPEASASVQDLYAQLFPVVQAVITDQNADIDQLLDRREHRRPGADRQDQLTVRGARPGTCVPGRAPLVHCQQEASR